MTREAPMGEAGLISFDDSVFLGQRIVSYRPAKDKLLSEFLLFAFLSANLQNQIKSMASGSTVQHMRVPDSQKLKLTLPNIEEQYVITAKIKEVRSNSEALVNIYQQKIDVLNELKQSLLHQAFTGKLARCSEEALEAVGA